MFKEKFKIGKKTLSNKGGVLTIAEIGVNHEGNFQNCIKLIKKAKLAGADFAKLQFADPEKNYDKKSKSYEIFKKANLSREEVFNAYKYAKKININIFSTFDRKNFEFYQKLNPICYKISSSLFKDFFFIKEVLSKNKPVLISTGLSNIKDINYFISLIKKEKNKKISLMHCVSLYPARPKNINLSRIQYFKDNFKIIPGFSDHTLGIKCAADSVHYGSKIIEKHFTLDKKKHGYDHKISIEGKEFKEMVKQIRINEEINGEHDFKIEKKDLKIINLGTRDYITKTKILKNTKITKNNITCVKLNKNYNSDNFYKIFPKILKKTIKKNLKKGSILRHKDFK